MPTEHTYIKNIGQRNLRAPLRVYFAGKVAKGFEDWRAAIFLNERIMSQNIIEMPVFGGCSVSVGTVIYGGPTALSCDHGCWHSSDHGIVNSFDSNRDLADHNFLIHTGRAWPEELLNHGSCPDGVNGISKREATERCMYQIRSADAMYVYIDSLDCYGTLTEIGYAYAMGIPIHLVLNPSVPSSREILGGSHNEEEIEHDEFWFVKQMASTVDYGGPSKGLGHIAYREPDSPLREKSGKRDKIRPKDRIAVLVRDNYQCQMCGISRSDGAVLEIDHIHPVSRGGSNELTNLQVLCRECNAGKSDKIIPMPWRQNEDTPLRWEI